MTAEIFVEKVKEINLKRVKWKAFFAFEAYGVRIGIRSNSLKLIKNLGDRIPLLIPVDLKEIDFAEAEYIFSVYWSKSKNRRFAYKGEEQILSRTFTEDSFDYLESQIRMTVAEFAEGVIFLHAGVVGYKGKAIIIPAKSFAGKTTLVAELAKRGLDYYSDEYAVIDEAGLVHPFPKKLSIRGIVDDWTQVDISVEELGGKKGHVLLEVGVILVQKYKKSARFRIEELSAGGGIIEGIANSVSIRQKPEFVLKILGTITNRAIILKTDRNDAKKFVDRFLPYLDKLEF